MKSASSQQLPENLTLFCGFDITNKSLQVGNLVPIRILKLAKDLGYRTIGLTGSVTTLLGDPSGRNDTRPMLSKQEIEQNRVLIGRQIQSLAGADMMVDNKDWFENMTLVEFMRSIGCRSSVNQLLSAETFKNRIDNQIHLSFMEFSYSLLQGYDMYHLHQNFGCNTQVGGSDQWFNMTQGIAYCKKMGFETHCITADLLVKADGTKMGKSVSGTVFLDAAMTSVYDFWQFWRNVDDVDVERCLLQMTDVPIEEIARIVAEDMVAAKKLLADEITKWVHGEENQKSAREKSESIFENHSVEQIDKVVWDFGDQISLDNLLYKIGMFGSISEAKRSISSGSVTTMDGKKLLDPNQMIQRGEHVFCFGKRRFKRVVV